MNFQGKYVCDADNMIWFVLIQQLCDGKCIKVKIPFKWENLYVFSRNGKWSITSRAKVIGGWIVKDYKWNEKSDEIAAMSSIFVPDKDHLWEIDHE